MSGLSVDKPLFIGLNEDDGASILSPISAESGNVLASVMGFRSVLDVHNNFELKSLMEFFPGSLPARTKLSTAQKNMAGRQACSQFAGRVVFVYGRNVARSLGLSWVDPFSWEFIYGAKLAVCPKLAPNNQWWEDPALATNAKTFLRGMIDKQSRTR